MNKKLAITISEEASNQMLLLINFLHEQGFDVDYNLNNYNNFFI